jgi:hypothetical protein
MICRTNRISMIIISLIHEDYLDSTIFIIKVNHANQGSDNWKNRKQKNK